MLHCQKGVELCRYNLSENYDGKTAMIFGEIYLYNGEWKFNAIGEPTNDNSISVSLDDRIFRLSHEHFPVQTKL